VTAAEVADRLGARRAGSGWLARCPAHPDRTPSLSIAEGAGGRVLLHCLAGCATAHVLAAAGLTWAEISGAPSSPAGRQQQRRERDARQAADEVARTERREAADAYREVVDRADRLAGRLVALEMAGAAPAYSGEAGRVAAEYHTTMDELHEADAAWTRTEVSHAA